MKSEVYEVSLDEITEFQNGFAFKSSDYVEPSAGTDEVLRMGYIMRGGGYKEDETPVFIPEEYPKNLSRYQLKRGDIVMAMTDMKNNVAILGNTARIPESGRFVLNQRVGRIRVLDPEVVDPLFLYYYTNSPDFIDDIRSRANSGVQVNLSTAAIKSSKVRLPPIDKQRSIGRSLNAMDEKIANNRALAADLEAMARAIFKSWFVDFDPVKAKMEGRAPAGMDAETAALFPDELVESELGLIPNGWEVGGLSEVLTLQRGFDLPAKNRVNGEFPVIAASGRSTFHEESKVQGPGVVTGRSGVIGNVYLEPKAFWPLNTTLWVKEYKKTNPFHAYFLLRDVDFEAHRGGSAVPTLNRNHVHVEPVVSAPPQVTDAFQDLARLLFERIWALEAEAEELAQLRDTLLPRLISGKLRLSEAAESVEVA